MKTTTRAAIIFSGLIVLSACSGGGDEPRSEPPPVEETAFGDMVGTMDKARSVEETTKQRKEQLDEALEASESR